jgi:hypothetical protein
LVYSDSERNNYQKQKYINNLGESIAASAYSWEPHLHLWTDYNVGSSTPHNPVGLHWL